MNIIVAIIKAFIEALKTGRITVHVKEGKLSGVEINESRKL